MKTTRLKKHRTVILVYTVGFFAVGIFIAVASFPTVFWNVRPVWLNAEELKSWAQQSEPLSQSELGLLQKIIVENYNPEGMAGAYAFDVLSAHMHHQEESIVDMLEDFVRHSILAKDSSLMESSLFLLRKVSSKHKCEAITVFRDQLLNDDHGARRFTIVCYSIDGLFKLDPAGSRELIHRFVNDSDDSVASHASYILGLIDEQYLNESKSETTHNNRGSALEVQQ